MGASSAETRIRKFWARVQKTEGCWIWTGTKTSQGYGKISFGGGSAGTPQYQMAAHRFAWALENGPIPGGKILLHTCDNTACVRPAHLRVGTHADNTADKVAKGRHARGPMLPRTRLPYTQVEDIRARVAAGEKQIDIARRYGIAPSYVSHLKSGRNRRAA